MAMTKPLGTQVDFSSGDLSIDTNTLHVDSTNNRVGIGTASPTWHLHVNEPSSDSAYLKISNSTTGSSQLTDGFDIGITATEEAVLYNRENTAMRFGTNNTERMRIDSSGNVGIGTSSPSSWSTLAALDSNGTGFAGITAINSNANVGIGGIQFASDTTYTKAAIGLLRQYPNGGGALVFYNDSNADASNWTTSDEKMRIDASGNLLVGSTSGSPWVSSKLFVSNAYSTFTNSDSPVLVWNTGTSGLRGLINFRTGAIASPTSLAGITTDGTSVSYNTYSDYRLKEDWQPMSGSIDRVKALNPVNFAWISSGKRVDGFLAHEAQEVVPEAITGTKDAVDADGNPEYQGIDQSKLVPLLTAALQEAITKIESLETEMITVKSRLDALESA